MRNLIEFSIADIRFVLVCPDSVVLQDPDGTYPAFRSTAYQYTDTVTVRVHPEPPRDFEIEMLEKIFETGRSWRLFRDRGGYWLLIEPARSAANPHCAMRFNPASDLVEVYCPGLLTENEESGRVLANPFTYPLDRLLMMYLLSARQGAMFHSAGVHMEGKGYMFPGQSGAGKSTLSRKFAARKRPVLLTDERVVVRDTGNLMKVFGTPWPGEEEIALNKGAPLAGIFFIGKGAHSIRGIERRAAMERLLPCVSVPWYDREVMERILLFCEDLIESVPAYEFQFERDKEVVDAFADFVSKE